MRILLSTYGSRGDVQPLVAVALALRARGVDAVISAPPDPEYVQLMAQTGVAMAQAFMAVRDFIAWARDSGLGIPGFAARMAPAQFEAIAAAADGCDAILATGLFPSVAAAQAVAEARRLPFVFTAFCPLSLPSRDHPPFERPGATRPPALSGDNAALWAHNDAALDGLFKAAVDDVRACAGLPLVSPVQRHVLTDQPWLACDPLLGPWRDDSLSRVVQTGAWLMADARPLPQALEAFLEAGPPPVFVGFGSMPMLGAPDVARIAVEAVRGSGHRILLSRGVAGLSAEEDSDCFMVGEASHQTLFPRVAAVVHHGGAGTTTTAARAGVPQVIVPQIVDQPYWAARVAALSIGVAHAGSAPTVETLSAALAMGLTPAVAERARELSGTIRADGAEEAARLLIEQVGANGAGA